LILHKLFLQVYGRTTMVTATHT